MFEVAHLRMRESRFPVQDLRRIFLTSMVFACMAGCTGDETSSPSEDVPLTGTLEPRPDVRSCNFDGHPPGVLPQVALEAVAVGTSFSVPVSMVPAPDGTMDVLVLERDGGIWRLSDLEADVPTAALILDAPPDIAEAMTMTTSPLHPDHVLVTWRTAADVSRMSRLTIANGAIDIASERIVMSSASAGRAAVSFDDTGLVYVAFADSTNVAADSTDADDHTTVEGSVSRIDISTVDATGTFAIPADNPSGTSFGGASDPVATWALGMRSPGACAAGPNLLWCSDLGSEVSEVHRVLGPGNLGWPDFDGTACQKPQGCALELDRFPQATVPRTEPCGVIGVEAYSGSRFPSLNPALIYVDSCADGVHAMLLDAPDRTLHNGELAQTDGVTGVGRDGRGEVFVLTAASDVVHRVVVPMEDASFPSRLSDSGCFADVAELVPNPGVVPYDVNAALWTDGSDKGRFIDLPPGTNIEVREDGGWQFPVGAVVLKTFSYDGAPVEVRAMVMRSHGWEFHSYRFDDASGDALLLDDSAEQTVRPGLTHSFPSRSSCRVCHRVEDVKVIGVRSDQLNRIVQYPDGPNEQLVAMSAIGMFASVVNEAGPRMAQPFDDDAVLEHRARAYLHTNCAHCHQPGGWVPSEMEMDLRYETPLSKMAACDVPSRFGTPGVLIASGDPAGSRVLERLRDAGNQRMPPLATDLVDDRGAAVVADWISSLAGCP